MAEVQTRGAGGACKIRLEALQIGGFGVFPEIIDYKSLKNFKMGQ